MSESPFNEEDSRLVSALYRLSKKSPKLVRAQEYTAPSDPSITVTSWRMNEFKYYDVPSPFPTLARGLFTRQLPSEPGGEPLYQIIARGYDKFFNIGEVPWTDWSSMQFHTGPDYTLSVKSNGCIIFIAAVTPSKLIVTSKHALGSLQGVEETHSQAGHRWLRKHLADRGKTEEQLAATLWEKRWTAVAELCDDNFEEHVLPYPPEKSGLHLHGINETHKAFYTLPSSIVNAFAEEWGFIKTPTLVLNSISEVRAFTDEVAKTGNWRGEPLEGFVVRTQITDPKPGSTVRDRRPPYPTGSSFLFKVKFDEPYMMYRDWREVTKILLSAKGPLIEANIPKSKLKRQETQLYVKWVKEEIKTNRAAFSEFSKGKGIISTRERFLDWMKSKEGAKDLQDLHDRAPQGSKLGKTIIVPVAIPGCGKTAVSVALAHLFGFGHTQSDDVHVKKPAPHFVKNVAALLKDHDVVIADKNNHLRQHRTALREVASKMNPPASLLALNWSLEKPPAMIHRLCGDRILSRGDKHQTLRADAETKSHEDVIWEFLRGHEELGDNEVDASIEMEVDDSLDAAVSRAVDGCVQILGLEKPRQERIDEAVRIAREYAPKTKASSKKVKDFEPRYFGILPEIDLHGVIGPRLHQAEEIPEDKKAFWHQLVANKRITNRPHITIVHRKSVGEQSLVWELCETLHRMPRPPFFSFNLAYLLWNDRVMALVVEDFRLATESNGSADAEPGQQGSSLVSQLPHQTRDVLHVTVGTADPSIPPVEAKALLEAWKQGNRSGINSLEIEGLSARGRIRGLRD
ncbi:RNA ligase-domain-containing protein [Pisolithus croceorrhizus]|nr:RNA ligase-domain-containing protein [Pisolithus croceorrhizus]KAI6131384.1 RNA ligase-domain-containing protein [Pisolithus croceorrhizus]KAI6156401.1 RNA ligase-domain-containing protein [Pisolithus thermaeus]